MVKRRQLTEDERRMCLKSLKRLEEEREDIEAEIKYLNFVLGERLWRKYLRDLKMYREKLKEENRNLYRVNLTIQTLHEQLREGVIVKEDEEKVEGEVGSKEKVESKE